MIKIVQAFEGLRLYSYLQWTPDHRTHTDVFECSICMTENHSRRIAQSLPNCRLDSCKPSYSNVPISTWIIHQGFFE
ncbi:unnamed protein product, partial [Nesidiocoris tenuis]